MLLFIISIVLLIVGFFLIWYCIEELDSLFGSVISSVVTGLGVIGVFVIGVGGLVTNNSIAKDTITIELNERIESINNSKKSLESKIESKTYTILEINDYNNSVREYKTEVAQAHLHLNNIWINWMTCSAYNNFDVNAVSYLVVD